VHGAVLDRLGLDILHVTMEGDAVVHGRPEKILQLEARSASLPELGVREQFRWIAINRFEVIPNELRVNDSWLGSLNEKRKY